MAALTITLGSRTYDGVMPIVQREAAIPGVDIQPSLDNNVPRLFGRLFKGEVDVSEMSLAELIYYTSRGRADFVGIPVFPSRVFRHAFLFCSASSGITGPGDLNGHNIGFQRWVQTARVWMRGMLVDQYGVAADKARWYVSSAHHWEDEPEEEIRPRDGSRVNRYATSCPPELESCCEALFGGEVDVVGITENQAGMLLADSRARRLFTDYRSEEVTYYRRTRIFPIMHVLAMRRGLVDSHPELPADLFRLFCESKKLAQSLNSIPSWSFAWKDPYLEDERGIFGGDPWCFG